MKKRKFCFLVWIATMLLSSCAPQYESLDANRANQYIANRTDIIDSKQLIKILYLSFAQLERSENLSIQSVRIKDNLFESTMVVTINDDDVLAGEKYILEAYHLKNKTWKVISIKKSWKCHEGYCHTDWGI